VDNARIAPPAVHELRAPVRYRAKLVALRTGLKAQVKAQLAKFGLQPPVEELWGPVGTAYLDQVDLPHGDVVRLESMRDLVGAYDGRGGHAGSWRGGPGRSARWPRMASRKRLASPLRKNWPSSQARSNTR
jgi:hypothetical protein